MKSEAWPGLSVCLHSNGADLVEYEDEGSQEGDLQNNTVRYVESIPGETFSIVLRTSHPFRYQNDHLESIVHIDGVDTVHRVHRPEIKRRTKSKIKGLNYNDKHGRSFCQKFAFAEIQTTEEEAPAKVERSLTQIGTITVGLVRVVVKGESHVGHAKNPVDSALCEGVPEKVLKGRAISNYVKFTESTPSGLDMYIDAEYPWGMLPFVTFTFKYRSHRDLQIEGLIPRSESPVPLGKRDPDSLIEEIDSTTAIKREKREHLTSPGNEDDDDAVIFSHERKRLPKRARTTPAADAQIIELSD